MAGIGLGEGEAWYQSEPLTTRLKNLIRDYPEGVGIIKELIQNADDAGATRVEIIFDWRTHSFQRLPDPRMEALMGASMLVYNDSKFTDEDFKNIQSLGDSGKRETLWKTGRFGVGFNSVYHVTDHPSFISRDRIVFFDPHASAIPGATLGQPGHSWRFEDGWWDYPDFMKVYEPGGLRAGITHFDGTLFRLPLRNVAQAKQSKIRNEPFSQENVRQLLAEFVKAGEEMLLFLKSVLTIRVSEINPDGSKRDLLAITTQNEQAVKIERKKLLTPLHKGADTLLTLCQGASNALPAVSYQHTIKVATPENQTISTWRVTSLMRAEGELLSLMQEMTAQGEKAVPWAGAAALISRTGNTQQKAFVGRAYCFLPLPQETGLPVHINGFFDLDSSRRELTSDTLTGRDKKRVLWNQLLVRHVLSHAYANLIVSLVEDVGETEPERFYQFFPTKSTTKALTELPTYVIKLLQPKRVIRSTIKHPTTVIQQNGQRQVVKTHWVTPQTIKILPKGWESLLDPLRLDGIDLPDPTLPPELEAAFSRADTPLTVFEPIDLRSRLLTKEPLGVPVAKAPKACLRKREWVTNLLRYCLSDGCRDVQDLPLAILADGTLQSFGHNPPGFIYILNSHMRQILMDQIFASRPDWFLDTEFSDRVREISPCQGASVMTPSEVAKRLKDLIDPNDEVAIEWEPDGEQLPNAAWLTHIYNYLIEVENLPLEELIEVPLVPCNDGKLYPGGHFTTPLWVGTSTAKDILKTLGYFNIPLIQCEESLWDTIAKFRNRHPDQLIWRLTVPDLIDTLTFQEKLPPYDETSYKVLISFLVDRRWIGGQGTDDDDRKHKLRQLSIYPTTENVPTNLQNAFVPASTPPKVVGSLKLLQLGPTENSQEWKPLFDFLGVPVLDRVRMIQNLVANYKSFDATGQVEALAWIRDHLSIAQTESDQLSQNAQNTVDLKNLVRRAPLIQCTDGELRPAVAVYHPKSQEVVKQILGDRAYTPDMEVYGKNSRHWLDFFQELKMLTSPSADDLLAHVDRLIQQATQELTEAISKSLIDVYRYLEKNWERLEKAKVTRENKTLFEALRTRAWLPTERNEERLKNAPGYRIPPNKLYRSHEICFIKYANIVASQKPLFPVKIPEIKFLKALGFQSTPDRQSVVNHFKELIELWKGTNGNGIDNDAFHKSVQNIYLYFSNTFCSSGASDADRQWLRNQLSGYECLWDYGKFWLPEHTFQERGPYFGKRRQKILISKSQICQVYELLGQKKSPDVDDFISFVEEVGDECRGEPLGEEDAMCVYGVLQQLDWELEKRERSVEDLDLLLLTDDFLLLPPEQILIRDAPLRLEAIQNDRTHVKFLHDKVPQRLAIAAGCRSLLKDVREQPQSVIDSSDEEAKRACQRWQKLLRSAEFQAGLERLLIDQYGLEIEVDLSWLTQVKVVSAAKILTDLLFEGQCIASGVQGDHYFNPVHQTFYLRVDDDAAMVDCLAESLNDQLAREEYGALQLNDISKLVLILKSSPSKIEDLLTRRGVRSLRKSHREATIVSSELEEDQIFDDDVSDEFDDWLDESDKVEASSAAANATATPPNSKSSPSQTSSNGSASSSTTTEPLKTNQPTPSAASQNGSVTTPPQANSGQATSAATVLNRSGSNTSAQTASSQRRSLLDISPQSSTPEPLNQHLDDADELDEDFEPTSTTGHRETDHSSRSNSSGHSGSSPRSGNRNPSSGRNGRTSYSGKPSQQTYRNGVRVGSGLTVDDDPDPEEQILEDVRRQIDAMGTQRVMEYEKAHGRTPKDMNEVYANHPGYDIESVDATGDVRYIEVKSLRGHWGRRGVKVTRNQFETGEEYQDQFWLYVVEQAETDEAKLTPIQNPVGLVGEFYYDDSWRQLIDDEASEMG